MEISITIAIVFIVLCCLLVIYLGMKKWPKTTESKISEVKRESLNEENLDSTIIEHEVKLIQKERDIEKLKRTLSSLETDYNLFKYYKNSPCIFLGIRSDLRYYGNFEHKYEYECTLTTEQKNSYVLYLKCASIFTSTETQQLYSIFPIYNEISVICNRDRYKLNKGTKLYDTIMTRIDNYYQNQIEIVNKKLKNN